MMHRRALVCALAGATPNTRRTASSMASNPTLRSALDPRIVAQPLPPRKSLRTDDPRPL